MSEPMQARFYVTERDYVRAYTLYMGYTHVLYPLIGVILGVCGAALGTKNEIIQVALWAVIAVGLVVVVHQFLFFPQMLRRDYRVYKLAHQEQTVTLLDDGVRFDAPSGSTMLAWNVIHKWRCSADYVLIYPMPSMYYIVPCTVAADGFDVERLKAELTRHVGAAA